MYEKRGGPGPPLERVYLIPTVSLMMIDWLTTTIFPGCGTGGYYAHTVAPETPQNEMVLHQNETQKRVQYYRMQNES